MFPVSMHVLGEKNPLLPLGHIRDVGLEEREY